MVRLTEGSPPQPGSPPGLLAAVQFLTRIPVRLRGEPEMARVAPWFPLVGGSIGVVIGAVAAGLWHLVPALVAASLAIAVGLLITGAFHEDGLGDVADAFGGGWTVERRLEILRDPRHGTYGVAAMCSSIVIRLVALGSLPGPAVMFAAMVSAHAMARAGTLALMLSVRSAKPSGLGFAYGRLLSRSTSIVGIVAGAAAAALATGWWVVPLALATLLAAAAVAVLALRKIGGIGGDVLGAAEQVAECACLVVITGLAARSSLWWR